MNIEQLILKNLQYNEEFTRKVAPFIKEEYFSSASNKILYKKICSYFEQYNKLPSFDELYIDITSSKIPENFFEEVVSITEENHKTKDDLVDIKWLLETTERFCKDRALFLGLQESIAITQGNVKNLSTTAIPEILSKALSVCFDSKLGHDYINNAKDRYEYYSQRISKIPFHLQTFNNITDGGVERKTLNCVMGITGGGKTLFMTDICANYALQGYNVLYITMEMAEEKIAQRIDANLLDLRMKDLKEMSETEFMLKMSQVDQKLKGRIKIKEYPNFGAHVGNFRYLLREYKTKHNFIPDIIVIDYMNICASSRIKAGANSYEYVKSVCEELRGLAVEQNVAVWTGTQANRSGYSTSDIGMEHTSESMGGPMTFDFFIGLIATDELIRMDQIMITQLKSRYADINSQQKQFTLGLDRSKMKFYDLTKPPSNNNLVSNTTNSSNLNFNGVKI